MSKFRLRGRRRKNRPALRDRVPLRSIAPNLITSIAACAGITSIVISATNYAKTLSGAPASPRDWFMGLLALLVACICDAMDGRVARLLNASSKLGAELDSLADFVNFGVAPAMFMYFWMTGGPGHTLADGTVVARPFIRIVLGCALYYALCDCFRLARFNTMLEQETAPYWKHFFTGVPAPGGCWMVLTPALLSMSLAENKCMALQTLLRNPWFGMASLLFVGMLMASRLPTISLKALHISKPAMPFFMAGALLLIGLLVAYQWLAVGVLGMAYVLTVPVTCAIFLNLRAKHERGLTSTLNKS
jgi:CDP-diacylglycerol--serine O-phosphatidyltransferase